jgi:hypothetical protein
VTPGKDIKMEEKTVSREEAVSREEDYLPELHGNCSWLTVSISDVQALSTSSAFPSTPD